MLRTPNTPLKNLRNLLLSDVCLPVCLTVVVVRRWWQQSTSQRVWVVRRDTCVLCHAGFVMSLSAEILYYISFLYIFFCYFLSKLTNLCCIFERQLLLYPCSVLIILWYTGRLRVSGEDQDDQEKTGEAQSGRIYNTKDDAYLGGSRDGSSWQTRMASESGPVHPCFRSLATV